MTNADLDSLLSVLENPIRREILSKLAKETHYPLQLSKELNVSQQAIMKHLKILEEEGLVRCYEEKSTIGPPRKCYTPTKQLSLRIDLGPNTFSVDIRQIQDEMIYKEYQELEDKYVKASEIKDQSRKLQKYSDLLSKINTEIESLEEKRDQLLSLKQHILKETYSIIADVCESYQERTVLYHIIEKRDTPLTISEELNIRESIVEEIFSEFFKKRILK